MNKTEILLHFFCVFKYTSTEQRGGEEEEIVSLLWRNLNPSCIRTQGEEPEVKARDRTRIPDPDTPCCINSPCFLDLISFLYWIGFCVWFFLNFFDFGFNLDIQNALNTKLSSIILILTFDFSCSLCHSPSSTKRNLEITFFIVVSLSNFPPTQTYSLPWR